jgi:cobalt/nickel transport system ATP-binding protein
MNLSGFGDRPPHYLSGGEKKRVSIADIIAMKSEVMIFDEPTASLDPLNAMMLEDVLLKLGGENKTLLISTHDVDFTYRWAERVLVFCSGKIIADGTPLEIFRNLEILKQANLKQPIMLEVYDMLVGKKILPDTQAYPKKTQELKTMLENNAVILGGIA